jgi:hypothetical protein
LAARLVVTLRNARNAALLKRGGLPIKDAIVARELVIAMAVLSAIVAAIASVFTTTTRAAMAGGVAPAAAFVALTIGVAWFQITHDADTR